MAGDNETFAFIPSGDNHTINEEDYFAVFLAQPHVVLRFILGIIAITLNALSLAALHHVRGRSKAHFQFITSLAVSDILIAITFLANALNGAFNPLMEFGKGSSHDRLLSFCAFIALKALNTTGLNISLLNLLGMAVDHHLAILNPLHNDRILSKSRAAFLITTFWIIAFLLGYSDFFAEPRSIPKIRNIYNVSYCEAVWATRYNDEYCMFGLALFTCTAMMILYIRICVHIRGLETPGTILIPKSSSGDLSKGYSVQQRRGRMLQRNKRAMTTTLLILGTFLLCWMPTCIFQITMIIYARMDQDKQLMHTSLFFTLVKLDKFLMLLMLCNCIADPVIYALRVAEIKHGYMRLFRIQTRKRSSSYFNYFGSRGSSLRQDTEMVIVKQSVSPKESN